jgi:predicted aminopeptidase
MLVMLFLCGGLSGCYVMQAARGQMDVMSRREPIHRVIERLDTTDTLRRRLEYVVDAREFAVTALGLPDNDSYRTYADVGRRFVVWNVFATPEFSVEPHRWCFPIAGCVVYRGYFRESAAQRYARRLRAAGYDASVGGVAAYSTLGHFADPLLNTMLHWSDAQLAATMFHELAHQVIYLPSDSEFNEAFATVVEEEGIKRWLEHRGDPVALAQWREQRQRQAAVSKLLLETREKLRSLYASELPPREMRYRKHQVFGELKFRYERLKSKWKGYRGYDHFFDRALNNAHLVAAATYRECVPMIRREFVAAGSDFKQFYERMRALTADRKTGGVCKDLDAARDRAPENEVAPREPRGATGEGAN